MEIFYEFLITALLSILLAFVIGKLFAPVEELDRDHSAAEALPEADPQLRRAKIGGGGEAALIEETRKRLGEGGVSEAEAKPVGDETGREVAGLLGSARNEANEVFRSEENRECGEDKRLQVGEVGFDGVSGKKMAEERFDVDLVKEEEERLLGGEVSPLKTKASEYALDKEIAKIFEVNEVGLEEGSAKEVMAEVVGTEIIRTGLLEGEGGLINEEESSEEARTSEFDIDKEKGAKEYSTREIPMEVEMQSTILVKEEDEGLGKFTVGEEKIVGSAEVPESEIRGEAQLMFNEEDEWEGIERTELEKLFGKATAYVSSESGGDEFSRLSGEEQLQLYALHKVATEGPCYDPQPMALKVSARARWHSWQRLGNMNPDVAMEQYVTILSEKIPGWTGDKPVGDFQKHGGSDSLDAAVSGTGMPDICSSLKSQLSSETERKPEGPSCIDEDITVAGSNYIEQGLRQTEAGSS